HAAATARGSKSSSFNRPANAACRPRNSCAATRFPLMHAWAARRREPSTSRRVWVFGRICSESRVFGDCLMSTIITGVVTNGLIVPAMPLPEGARVEIHLQADRPEASTAAVPLTPSELRKLPRKERDAILTEAVALAE